MISNSKLGYTLIEVLVVILILSLLFGFGFINYRDFARRQAVIAAGRSIRADLRLAQEEALAGKKPSSGCTVLNGYLFSMSTSSYAIYPNCDSGPSSTTDKGPIFLPTGITSTTGSVTFKVLGLGTDLSSDLVFTLSQTGTSNQETVTVTAGGEVK